MKTAELDGLYALGWRKSVFFVDDNFIGNKKLFPLTIMGFHFRQGIELHVG